VTPLIVASVATALAAAALTVASTVFESRRRSPSKSLRADLEVARAFEVKVRRADGEQILAVTDRALRTTADSDIAAMLSRELRLSAAEAAEVVHNLRQRSSNAAESATSAGPAMRQAGFSSAPSIAEKPLGPRTHRFERRLPAAAASQRPRVARDTITSTDGSVSVELADASRREVQLRVAARNGPADAIAVIRLDLEGGPTTYLVPLVDSAGSAVIVTMAPVVTVDLDIELVGARHLEDVSAGYIARSISAATAASAERWVSLGVESEADRLGLSPVVAAIIRDAAKASRLR
jgi:hypothetical protein